MNTVLTENRTSPFDYLLTYQEMYQKRQEIQSNASFDSENYLAFKAGDESYLLNMTYVFEVATQINEITPLPFSPRWLLGLTSHRTDIYSVVDFKNFVGKKQNQSSSNARLESSFILLHKEGQGYILKVDEVYGIRSCEVTAVQSQFAWIDGQAHTDNKDWLRINMKSLINDASFIQNIQ